MRAILTVVGKDRVGIIAGICTALSAQQVNVLDINQTILQDMFTMSMLVDIGKATLSFTELAGVMEQEGQRLGVNVRIQREDIFDAMHRI